MPRAFPQAARALLAIVVLAPGAIVNGQAPAPESPDTRHRLEEMKVELALLGDKDTFPFSLGASVRDGFLELYGFVPDDKIRQHALEVAGRNTTLKVSNTIGLRADLGPQSAVRSSHLLQPEAVELLRKNLREQAKPISVMVRANGTIAVTGRIHSLESKLEVSRLFRQLSGCAGIDNQLTVEPIVRNGQRLVQVTRDGSLLVPPSALGSPESLTVFSSRPEKLELASFPDKVSAVPSVPKPSLEPNGDSVDALSTPKLPVKWGRPTESWETRLKQLEAARELPTPLPPTPRLAETKPNRGKNNSQPNFAAAREMPGIEMTWRRPGSSEESEPRITPVPISPEAPEKLVSPPKPSGPPLRSSRRWPPAYVAGEPANKGRPGVIIFADDPPSPKPAQAVSAIPRIVPADLQRQVKSICGRNASEVIVSPQPDGSVLVKVKVPNRAIEDQLSRKILDLPVMTSPQVRLMMDVAR